MRDESDTHRVVVVATPETPVFELAIPCEVFGIDRDELTSAWYTFELIATGPEVATTHGLVVPPGRGIAALTDADTIIIPACGRVHDNAPPALLTALRYAHERGARIASLCSGAFVLAQAGILDGRRATTHWMHADELAAKYPRVQVDPSVLYVNDGVWTSAGSAAALDMCLEMVRVDHGASIANEVARRIVTPPHRSGGQAQYIRPRPVPVGPGLGDTLGWARRNLDTVTVTAIALRAGTSTRTLHRTMRRITGGSPQEWLMRERLRSAQELLESTNLTTNTIAARSGLGSAANLRVHFSRAVGLSPSQYRSTFATTGQSRGSISNLQGDGRDRPVSM